MLSIFKSNSIAKKLAISASLGIIVFWLAAVAAGGMIFQRELDEAFDESLRQAAIRLLPLALHQLHERNEHDGENRIVEGVEPGAAFSYSIYDRGGRAIMLSDDEPRAVDATSIVPGFSTLHDSRLYTLVDGRTGYSIVVAERSDHRREALMASIGGLLLPLGAFVPLVLVGIGLAIRKAMKPVEQLRQDIAKRSSRDLSPLSSKGQPAELAPIADEVAKLLERLRLALEAERTFAANSAHELRTPLAGALAQVQRLSIELGDKNSKARLDEVIFALRNLSDLSEKLLQLSRLESGFARSDDLVDLTPTLDLMIRDYRANSQNRNELRVTWDRAIRLEGHTTPDAFAVVVRNLLENAMKHGLADAPIDMIIDSSSKFRVINQCFIIPSDLLEHIGEPFQRGESKANGTGLGLSIVSSVIRQSGGSVSFNSPVTGMDSGFEAIIDLAANVA